MSTTPPDSPPPSEFLAQESTVENPDDEQSHESETSEIDEEVPLEMDSEDDESHRVKLWREKNMVKKLHEASKVIEKDESGESDQHDENLKEKDMVKKLAVEQDSRFEKHIKPLVYDLIKNIGYCENSATLKYKRGENYLKTLKDIKSILRENTDGRVRSYLQEIKIVQQDLVPLFATCISDLDVSTLILELLILLTNPITAFEREQGMELRIERSMMITKAVFTMKDVFAYFVVALGENLVPDKNLEFIHLILILTRNILAIQNNHGVPQHKLDTQLIQTLSKDGFLDLFLALIPKDGERWPKLFLEILSILMRDETVDNIVYASKMSDATLKPDPQRVKELQEMREQEKLKQEKLAPPTRHSRFGGVVVNKPFHGATQFIDPRRGGLIQKPKKKIVRKDRVDMKDVRRKTPNPVKLILQNFVNEFLTTCFSSFMHFCFEELAGEPDFDFEYHFLNVIGFVFEFNRLIDEKFDISNISALFGEEMINFVYARLDLDRGYIAGKNNSIKQIKYWKILGLTVSVLREIVLGIEIMLTSENEDIRDGAYTLFSRLVYDQSHLYNIPKLIGKYSRHLNSKQHLCNLIEIAHVFIKISKEQRVTVKKVRKDEDMALNITGFVGQYFSKRPVLIQYVALLNGWATNAFHLNDQLLGMLEMICEECDMAFMLYHISILQIFREILAEDALRVKEEWDPWIEWISTFTTTFFAEFEKDRELGVKILSWKKDSMHEVGEKDVLQPIVPAEDEPEIEFSTEAFVEDLHKPVKEKRKRQVKEGTEKKKKKTKTKKSKDIEAVLVDGKDREEAGGEYESDPSSDEEGGNAKDAERKGVPTRKKVESDEEEPEYDFNDESVVIPNEEEDEEYEFGEASSPIREKPVEVKIVTPMRSRVVTDSPARSRKKTPQKEPEEKEE